LGTRINTNKPKCLLKVGQSTLLGRQLALLEEERIKDISMVIGTKGKVWTQESFNQIQRECDEKSQILFNFENTSTQSSFSLLIGLRGNVKEETLVIDGDLLFSRKVLRHFLDTEVSALLTKESSDLSELGNRVLEEKGIVRAIGRQLIPIATPFFIYSGMMKIAKDDIILMKKEVEKKFEVGIEHALNSLCKKSILLNRSNSEWININTKNDYKRAIKCLECW